MLSQPRRPDAISTIAQRSQGIEGAIASTQDRGKRESRVDWGDQLPRKFPEFKGPALLRIPGSFTSTSSDYQYNF
ncbi:MAG: hypothetical protein AB4042_09095 [Leptolyngbyaceae cyanobacterium]